MKTSVEDGNLRHRTQQFPNNVHAFQFGTIVERSKNGNIFDRGFDFGGDQRRFEKLRTAVDDTMPHYVNIGGAGYASRLPGPQTGEQTLYRFCTRPYGSLIFSGRSAGVLDGELSLVILPLDLPLPDAGGWIVGELIANLVNTAFLAAGTGIEN